MQGNLLKHFKDLIPINKEVKERIRTFESCEHNNRKNRCLLCCDEKYKCFCGNLKERCRECKKIKKEVKPSPNSECEHNKRRCRCYICADDIYKCEHEKIKEYCHKCNKTQYCEHEIKKVLCKICDGHALCPHELQPGFCKDCSPENVCFHNMIWYRCITCNPGMTCEHGIRKTNCDECLNNNCEHNIRIYDCATCYPKCRCPHEKRKVCCSICYVKPKCPHDKVRSRCKTCSPNSKQLCNNEWCHTRLKNKKYKGYCLLCFIHEFPGEECYRNYKTKEQSVVDFVKQSFPNYSWIHDKRIQDGCSKRRPDLFLDMGEYILIIEVDEEKHDNYSCENKRIMEISQDVNHRSIIFIRFNPDKYTDKGGKKISSCWKTDKTGLTHIINTKEKKKEWEMRLDTLKREIENCIELNKDELKMIDIKHLFYE
jgi:hypothetical protein